MDISAFMQALQNQGIDEAYINILEEVNSRSTATTVLIKKSHRIPIKKGLSYAIHCVFTGGFWGPKFGRMGHKS